MVMEEDLTSGGEHTLQCTNDVLYNYIPETYMILLTNVTPTNSMKTWWYREKEKRNRNKRKNYFSEKSHIILQLKNCLWLESTYTE